MEVVRVSINVFRRDVFREKGVTQKAVLLSFSF